MEAWPNYTGVSQLGMSSISKQEENISGFPCLTSLESITSKGKKALGLDCPLQWPIHGKEAKLTASWLGQEFARNMALAVDETGNETGTLQRLDRQEALKFALIHSVLVSTQGVFSVSSFV